MTEITGLLHLNGSKWHKTYNSRCGRLTVVLAELTEEHAADGHVHTDAQGVGAADAAQQARPGAKGALGKAPNRPKMSYIVITITYDTGISS